MKMENRIYLVPFGSVDDRVLGTLDTQLKKTFNSEVEHSERMKLPKDAFSPKESNITVLISWIDCAAIHNRGCRIKCWE